MVCAQESALKINQHVIKDNILLFKGWNFGLDQMYSAGEMIKFFEQKDKGPMFGATYTGAGFKEAQAVLEKSKRRNKKVARAILLLTDGAPTDPEVADKVVSKQAKVF